MPAPPATLCTMTAKTMFASKGLKVPQNWKNPSGDPGAKHYSDAFSPSEKQTMPAIGAPLLFQPASLNKYHTDAQKMHVDKIGSFIEGITSALCSAVTTLQKACTMAGIVITGPAGVGGQMLCPAPAGPAVLMNAPKNTPMLLKYSNAVANAFQTQWMMFVTSIKSPGLPLWPMFATFPSPAAVNIPSAPLTLGMFTHAPITADALKGLMIANLGDPNAPFMSELFESIAKGFETWFNAWVMATTVNIGGSGPVPTMTTPVPVPGPVVGGIGVMLPGGLN